MKTPTTNRVKKLFMVEEDKLPKDVQEQLLLSGSGTAGVTGGGGGKTSDFVQQQISSPFTPVLEREILSFNEDLNETLKKPMPTKLKALELLRKINRYFSLKQQWEDQQRKEVLEMRKDSSEKQQQQQQQSDDAAAVVSPVSVPSEPPNVQIDPKSVVRYGKEKRAFSRENV